MNFNFFALFVMLSIANIVVGQDTHFSDVANTRSLVNVANTGNFSHDFQITTAYRNQYSSVPVGYNTFFMAFQARNRKLNLGAAVLSDKAGDAAWQTTQLSMLVSKNLKITETFSFAFGVMPCFQFNTFNPEKLQFNSQFNGDVFSINNANGENILANNSGFFSNTISMLTKYYITKNLVLLSGFSNKLNSKFSKKYFGNFNKYSSKNNLFANVQQMLNDASLINYEVNYTKQNKYQQLLINSIYQKKILNNKAPVTIKVGLGLRLRDAIIIYSGFGIQNFDINFCYDINFSGFSTATNSFGAAEISMVYKFYKSKLLKENRHACPVYL